MRVGTFLIIAAALACASFPPSNNGYYPDPLPDSPQQLSRSYRTSNYAVADSPPVIHKIELLVNSHPVFTIEVHASNLFEQAKSILVCHPLIIMLLALTMYDCRLSWNKWLRPHSDNFQCKFHQCGKMMPLERNHPTFSYSYAFFSISCCNKLSLV